MRIALIVIVALGMAVTLVSTARYWRQMRTTVPEPEGPSLQPGDRVFVSGGYEPRPAWLGDGEGYPGTLERFASRQDGSSAVVVRIDIPITAGGVTGEVLLMKLRYVDATWSSGALAHVELCDGDPEAAGAGSSPRCAWVESHASLVLLD